MTEGLIREVVTLTDVNVLAIALTSDHPAQSDVMPWVADAIDGPNVLLVPDYYPFRAQYIMTSHFGVSEVNARNAVQSLLRSPARIVSVSAQTLLEAYEISAAKNHDVYDSFLLAVATEYEVDYLITTDSDFETLCADEPVQYVNPVPEAEREKLSLADD